MTTYRSWRHRKASIRPGPKPPCPSLFCLALLWTTNPVQCSRFIGQFKCRSNGRSVRHPGKHSMMIAGAVLLRRGGLGTGRQAELKPNEKTTNKQTTDTQRNKTSPELRLLRRPCGLTAYGTLRLAAPALRAGPPPPPGACRPDRMFFEWLNPCHVDFTLLHEGVYQACSIPLKSCALHLRKKITWFTTYHALHICIYGC